MRNWIHAICGTMLAVGLVSCGAQRTETASTTDQISTTPIPEATTVTVSAIELGKTVGPDHRVTEQITIFAPGDPLHASVITNGAGANAEIKAVVVDANGKVVQETTRVISPTEATATEFTLANTELPVGTYKVEIFLNGASAGTKDFEVKSS